MSVMMDNCNNPQKYYRKLFDLYLDNMNTVKFKSHDPDITKNKFD